MVGGQRAHVEPGGEPLDERQKQPEVAQVDLDRLDPRTRMGLLELAAEVADAFPS